MNLKSVWQGIGRGVTNAGRKSEYRSPLLEITGQVGDPHIVGNMGAALNDRDDVVEAQRDFVNGTSTDVAIPPVAFEDRRIADAFDMHARSYRVAPHYDLALRIWMAVYPPFLGCLHAIGVAVAPIGGGRGLSRAMLTLVRTLLGVMAQPAPGRQQRRTPDFPMRIELRSGLLFTAGNTNLGRMGMHWNLQCSGVMRAAVSSGAPAYILQGEG